MVVDYIIAWLLVIIATEAITEIVVDSALFEPLRGWAIRHLLILARLINCGYCMSIWVAASMAWALPGGIIVTVIGGPVAIIADAVIRTFVVHRLSNIWHEAIKRWLDRHPFVMVFQRTTNDQTTTDRTSKD